MKATHTTKKGFGGLLKEGLKCRIVRQSANKVLIEVEGVAEDQNAMYNGELKELEEIQNP